MMQMLEAGGLAVLVDQIRQADSDNPAGYYEYEAVKELRKGETAWLAEAQGKVVKVISALLEFLPVEYTYRIIFMRRRIPEILASQRKMLVRRGERSDSIADEKLADIYDRHLRQVEQALAGRANVGVLVVDYNDLVADPLPAAKQVTGFLGGRLDPIAMARAVNRDLYRNRAEF